jgi:hypothetical protein
MENLQTEYTLTEDEKGMIIPIIETVENLQKEAQVVLRAITRLRGLEGQWSLMGDRLVKVKPAAQQLQAVGAADRNGNG